MTFRIPIAGLGLLCLAMLAGCQGAGRPGVGASAFGSTSLAAIRSQNGLSPLRQDARLERAAAQQAGYMARAGRMTHTVGPGRDFFARMKQNGIEGAAAENVAYNVTDRGRLFGMWMASSGHRRNMLDPRFGRYGLASAKDSTGRTYWALVMGR